MRSARRTRSVYYRTSCLGALAARQGSAMGQTASASYARFLGRGGPGSVMRLRALLAAPGRLQQYCYTVTLLYVHDR